MPRSLHRERQHPSARHDKYAAAWHELGHAYAADNQIAKARQSFEKAIAADSKYAPPYVSLAALKVEDQDYDGAFESIRQAVELDPNILVGFAGYIQAIANFRLNRLEAAEQSLLAAEKGPHQSTPQLHAMLADLYMRKQDLVNAAAQIRTYLKEAPQGSFAAELKKNLDMIEKSAGTPVGTEGGR